MLSRMDATAYRRSFSVIRPLSAPLAAPDWIDAGIRRISLAGSTGLRRQPPVPLVQQGTSK